MYEGEGALVKSIGSFPLPTELQSTSIQFQPNPLLQAKCKVARDITNKDTEARVGVYIVSTYLSSVMYDIPPGAACSLQLAACSGKVR